MVGQQSTGRKCLQWDRNQHRKELGSVSTAADLVRAPGNIGNCAAKEGLARVETIKKVHILDREFSVEEDELTPTLKMKRKNIESKFEETFDRLYDDASFGLVVVTA